MSRYYKKRLLMLAVLMIFMLFISSCSKAAIPTISKEDGYTRVGEDIYVFTSDFYMANMAVVVSGDKAALIDTGMDENDLERLRSFMEQNKLKLDSIFITHMHADHNANLDALKADDTNVITPDNAKDGQQIKLGRKNLKVLFTEGHYAPKGHISIEINGQRILFAGDVICNSIIPPIASGGNIEEILKTLDTLKNKSYTLIIPGHGDIESPDILFDRQYEYLRNAKTAVERVIEEGTGIISLRKIKLEDCIADPSYLKEERLDYWHQSSLQTIYVQLSKKKSQE